MRMRPLYSVLTVSMLVLIEAGSATSDNSTYGPFQVVIEKVIVCQRANGTENSELHLNPSYDKHPNGRVSGNLTIFKEDGPIQQFLEVERMSDEGFYTVFTYAIPNICDGTYLRTHVYDQFLKFVNSDMKCIVQAATMSIDEIDIEAMIQRFIGKEILYGKHIGHFELFTNTNNIVCAKFFLNFIPLE